MTHTAHACARAGLAAAAHARRLAALVLLAGLGVLLAARSGELRAQPAGPADAVSAPDAQGEPELRRTTAGYRVPAVTLVRDDGKAVRLDRELDDGRAVVMNFVYTSCTTICPLTSLTFAQLQGRLGASAARVHLVSISIDPEEDTPARLRAYAHRYGAGPGWQHYTGTVAASLAAQRAFNVLRDGKMSHAPVTLVRPTPGAAWVRIDGFASADQLLAELPQATASR